jgi:citronellol/citronellal dehydrogenase
MTQATGDNGPSGFSWPSYRGASPFSADLMRDKACVVTGGGTGIGYATADLLLRCGARVALLGRRSEVLDYAQTALLRDHQVDSDRVMVAACDIREPEAVEIATRSVCEQLGGIDVLINNAGGQFPSPAEGISPKGFEAVVRNNLLGTWNITREAAVQSMLARGGSVVNVIANVERGFPGMAHTGAARAGVENLTRTLAIEWVNRGVRVNCVAPGIIRTEAVSRYPEPLLEQGRRATPQKRLGSVEEIASTIVFVASDAVSFMTGATLHIDGGARLWGESWPV